MCFERLLVASCGAPTMAEIGCDASRKAGWLVVGVGGDREAFPCRAASVAGGEGSALSRDYRICLASCDRVALAPRLRRRAPVRVQPPFATKWTAGPLLFFLDKLQSSRFQWAEHQPIIHG
jgi:hypothetical protein